MTFEMLCDQIENFDPGTWEHSKRVSHAAGLLAKEAGLNSRDVAIVERGALLHDIGKIGVNINILEKNGPLTQAEREQMKAHVTYGKQLLSSVNDIKQEYINIAADHHAYALNPNGGYRAVGQDSHRQPAREARIVAIADVYDALTSERSYKKGYDRDTVRSIMNENYQNGQFDPELYVTFMEKVVPQLEGEKLLEQQGLVNEPLYVRELEAHPLTEQQWEDYYGVDIGKSGYRQDVRDRDKSNLEEDVYEKHYNRDFNGTGLVDESKQFEQRFEKANREAGVHIPKAGQPELQQTI